MFMDQFPSILDQQYQTDIHRFWHLSMPLPESVNGSTSRASPEPMAYGDSAGSRRSRHQWYRRLGGARAMGGGADLRGLSRTVHDRTTSDHRTDPPWPKLQPVAVEVVATVGEQR
jgi:hypothetical protein